MKIWGFIFLIAAVTVAIIGKYSCVWAADDYAYADSFAWCNAWAWVLILASKRCGNSIFTDIASEGFCILAFGEILDEILFRPCEIQWAEVAFLIIACCWISARIGYHIKHEH